ncbi:MAG: hypothetical protein CSA20_06995 [Deltaproteobacteria bacterium]|nr:MAG: hypothetical protein CSA20_06995 [Deltaproteobacteria bacterium]
MNNKGFTLIEFLVAMTVMLGLLTMASVSFQVLTSDVKVSTSANQTELDLINSRELLRLDIEHLGMGIANFIGSTSTDNNCPLVDWNISNSTLTIYSTLSNSVSSTIGWAVGACNASGQFDYSNAVYSADSRYTPSPTPPPSILLTPEYVFDDAVTTTSCPDNGQVFIAFPWDNSPGSNGCSGFLGSQQQCSATAYTVSVSQPTNVCDQQTRNLLRNSAPVFNCVADYQVLFDWDLDGNGTLASSEKNISRAAIVSGDSNGAFSTTANVRQRLKSVRVYILQQQGKRDENYTSTRFLQSNGNIVFTVDGVSITFKTQFATVAERQRFRHYRWKVITVTGSPRELLL